MIVETGHFALILALATALVQMSLPLALRVLPGERVREASCTAAIAQFFLVSVAFAALTWAYVTSDFSVLNVTTNSHSAKPLIYKISGVWGNHEGSMLLWILILVFFGALVAVFGRNLPDRLCALVLSVQAAIGVAFLAFVLITSNPFVRIVQAPLEGRGLNPILQDPGLAIHPPMLYAGYVGFSMAFSFAVAALIEGRIDAAWARWVRPWTLAAWLFLTLGIALGSYWAYYELGWGGWWFWDPVENASFMPWLVGTALLHSAVVMEKRDALKIWTVLLAILTFSLSLMGTFIVRSGVLTSVHAFAVDPERGVFILAIMVFFVGGSLALYAWRAPQLQPGGLFAPVSREGSLVLNNVLLTVATSVVFFGTIYPLVLDAVAGIKISIGPPFYALTFVPLILPLLIAVPFGPMLAWKRGDLAGVLQRLTVAAGLAALVAVISFGLNTQGPWLAPFVIGLGVWLVAGALSETAFRIKIGQAGWGEVWRRARNLPRAAYGGMLAHAGLGLMVIGITATTAWRVELVAALEPGEAREIAGYTVRYVDISERRGPNYSEQVTRFRVSRGGRHIVDVAPAKRLYTAPRQQTTEAGIHASWRGDLYVVLGDVRKDGGVSTRIYFNPLVRWIWIGALIMGLGAMFSLSDRRLRVGAGRRAKTGRIQGAETAS